MLQKRRTKLKPNSNAAPVYPADGQTFTLSLWKPRRRDFLFVSGFGRSVLEHACKAAGANILDHVFTEFGTNSGYTGFLVLAQSHCSIHTYPDREFVAIDIYTCGPLDTQRIVNEVVGPVKPTEYHVHTLPRLVTPPSQNFNAECGISVEPLAEVSGAR